MWKRLRIWWDIYDEWKVERSIQKKIEKAKKMWLEVEQILRVARMPQWKKKQIRRDIIKGNTTFFEERK